MFQTIRESGTIFFVLGRQLSSGKTVFFLRIRWCQLGSITGLICCDDSFDTYRCRWKNERASILIIMLSWVTDIINNVYFGAALLYNSNFCFMITIKNPLNTIVRIFIISSIAVGIFLSPIKAPWTWGRRESWSRTRFRWRIWWDLRIRWVVREARRCRRRLYRISCRIVLRKIII